MLVLQPIRIAANPGWRVSRSKNITALQRWWDNCSVKAYCSIGTMPFCLANIFRFISSMVYVFTKFILIINHYWIPTQTHDFNNDPWLLRIATINTYSCRFVVVHHWCYGQYYLKKRLLNLGYQGFDGPLDWGPRDKREFWPTGRRKRGEEALQRQYGENARAGTIVGLPKIDGSAGPGGFQLGPLWGVDGQTAVGYG